MHPNQSLKLGLMICCSLAWCMLDVGSLSLIASLSAQSPTEEIQFKKGWVLSSGQPPQRGRSSLPIDPIEHAWISSSLSMPDPKAEESPSAPGLQPWKPFAADEQSGFAGRNLFGAVLALHAPMQQPGIWMLDAQGHASVRINGSPRTGDVYANGSVGLPVALKAGDNWLLLQSGRGRIAAKLTPPPKPVFLSTRDTTFPTFLRDEPNTWIGSILLVNAQETPLENITLRASAPGCESIDTPVVSIPPLSIKKVPFALRSTQADLAEWKQDTLSVVITAIETNPSAEGGASSVDEITVTWPVRNSTQTHRRTFLSEIDNSVQYYGVVPPAPQTTNENPSAASTDTRPSKPPALILSLHGAGVEGEGQANVYSQKPNTYIIAPTNRRNFGFDWEDWGRWDAIEVLEQAQRRFQTDPKRTYITGHSMGGHGTWHIGTLFPDRFAALGPSAGWISFATYAGRGANVPQDPISVLMRRPLSTCDTLARVSNLKTQGVYILHGDADDNVPVDQARSMREELAKFHPDWVYKEQPGAGHWWGNACCDWPPMIDFFLSHQIADSALVPNIDFTTPGPHVSPSCHWFLLGTQDRYAEISHVQLQRSNTPWKIIGTTENVASFAIALDKLFPTETDPPDAITLEIDGSTIEVNQLSDWLKSTPSKSLWFTKSFTSADKWEWKRSDPLSAQDKNPNRYGVLKEAFRNRFILIYGTEGTPDENRWMLDKARFDAETFWYRGNGSVDCLSDTQWLALQKSNPQFLAERNCVVYGNATANAAWRELLASSPISIENGRWKFGDKPAQVESVLAWFLRPHPTSNKAMVAAIGGTDLAGMKSGTRLPLFSSGTAYPDAMIASPDFLKDGIDAVRNVGWPLYPSDASDQ